jgi:hypothetical protein
MDSTKTFEVKRMSNGRGISNLLLVFDEAIPDVYIGTALLVPMPTGFKDPACVTVIVDEKGAPQRTILDTCIVTEYIYK